LSTDEHTRLYFSADDARWARTEKSLPIEIDQSAKLDAASRTAIDQIERGVYMRKAVFAGDIDVDHGERFLTRIRYASIGDSCLAGDMYGCQLKGSATYLAGHCLDI
jgi:hypothetical protein